MLSLESCDCLEDWPFYSPEWEDYAVRELRYSTGVLITAGSVVRDDLYRAQRNLYVKQRYRTDPLARENQKRYSLEWYYANKERVREKYLERRAKATDAQRAETTDAQRAEKRAKVRTAMQKLRARIKASDAYSAHKERDRARSQERRAKLKASSDEKLAALRERDRARLQERYARLKASDAYNAYKERDRARHRERYAQQREAAREAGVSFAEWRRRMKNTKTKTLSSTTP